jgi:VWFA-related protein
LTDLSRSTGGETYEVDDMKDIEEIFMKISSALKHIYLITYQPPLEPDDGKWRHIEVFVGDEKSYRIRAKEGYFPK